MTRPTSRVGWRVSLVHRRFGPCGGSSSPRSSSSSARTIRLRSRGSIVSAAHGARAGELGVQRLGPARGELGLPALAHALGRRRAQVEVGERRAQVQAGAADDDRRRARRRASPSISACASCGVLAGAEARVDGHERDEPVLEPRALGRASATPVRVSRPRVDLQRVGGHRDRALAARAQAVGERERDGGLADAGRAEEGEHGGIAARVCRPAPAALASPHDRAWSGAASHSAAIHAQAAASRRPSRRAAALDGAHADLVVVFASGAHLAEPEATLEGVHEALAPTALIGCGAGGVLGGGREVEGGTAVACGPRRSDGGEAEPFHADRSRSSTARSRSSGFPDLDGAAGAILLPDPYSFPTDAVLARAAPRAPRACRSSAAWRARETPRRRGGAVPAATRSLDERRGRRAPRRRRAAAVRLAGRDAGRPRADRHRRRGHVIHELAGRPALEQAARRRSSSSARRARDARRRPAARHRRSTAASPSTCTATSSCAGCSAPTRTQGTIAVGAPVSAGPGRAPARARRRLGRPRPARGARPAPRGARRQRAGGRAGLHLQRARARHVRRARPRRRGARRRARRRCPSAGFFAAGEIGPVGGESFLHGFTATRRGLRR